MITRYDQLPGGDVAMDNERRVQDAIASDATVNEIRALRGAPAMEGGDVRLSEAAASRERSLGVDPQCGTHREST